jgi:hypothetical protein
MGVVQPPQRSLGVAVLRNSEMKPFVNIFITSISNHTAIAKWVDATCAYVLLSTTTFGSYDAKKKKKKKEEENTDGVI